MAYTPKNNEFALFENTRSPNKSELTGRAEIQCPKCGTVSGFWADAWHKTSQAGQAFIRVVLKPRGERAAAAQATDNEKTPF